MSISTSFHGTVILALGAYSFSQIAASIVNDAKLGIVALIGEANEGPAWAAETTGLKAVTFSSTQFGAIQAKYGSGMLVDAARIALNPANDNDIQGGAQQLVLMKTNQSVKASKAFASTYGTVYAKNYGLPGNNVNITNAVANSKSTFTINRTDTGQTEISSAIGGTQVISLLCTDGSSSAATLTISATAITTTITGGTTSSLNIPINQFSTVNDLVGYINTIPGYTAAVVTQAQALQPCTVLDRVTTINILSTAQIQTVTTVADVAGSLNNTYFLLDDANSAHKYYVWFNINSAGVDPAIAGRTAVPITGATGVSANTLATSLRSAIAALNGTASFSTSGSTNAVIITNLVKGAGSVADGAVPTGFTISVGTAGVAAYPVVRDAADVQAFFASSQLVDFTPGVTGYVGQPSALSKSFLASGARGATTQAQFQTCVDALSAAHCNFVVPLFSRDASGGDIADGITDSSSTYLIASVHAAIRSHCIANSTIKGRKERQAWVGYANDTFSNVQAQSATIGSSRVSLCFQYTDVQLADGSIAKSQPHMLAVIAAGMKAAAPVGLPNSFKDANINGFYTQNSSGAAFFDPETDRETGIASNLTFVETDPNGGFRFHVDNSTYGSAKDAWILNRPSVQYASDVLAKTIRLNTELYIGKRNADLNPTSITNFLVKVLDQVRAAGIIVPDTASNGKGYMNLQVKMAGNQIYPSLTAVLVEAEEQVLSDIVVTRASF